MFRTKLIISLLEDVLGLLQSLNPVLDLQNDLRLTQMVPYDSPWFPMPKNMGFDTKIKCQIQINNFTPWRGPWPPTAPPPISWPSDQSEAHENGPTRFPMPKKLGFDTKIKCQIQIKNFTPWRGPWPPTAPPPISWPSDQSEAHENGPTWFPMPKNGVWHQNQVSDSN